MGGQALAMPGVLVRAKFNLPLAASGLCRDERKRHFGKLDERTAILVRGQKQIAREFRTIRRGPPNRLAGLDRPARSGEIGWRQGHRAATGANQQEEGWK